LSSGEGIEGWRYLTPHEAIAAVAEEQAAVFVWAATTAALVRAMASWMTFMMDIFVWYIN
jgi:hypothetical protein